MHYTTGFKLLAYLMMGIGVGLICKGIGLGAFTTVLICVAFGAFTFLVLFNVELYLNQRAKREKQTDLPS